jgi:hypothetical protein
MPTMSVWPMNVVLHVVAVLFLATLIRSSFAFGEALVAVLSSLPPRRPRRHRRPAAGAIVLAVTACNSARRVRKLLHRRTAVRFSDQNVRTVHLLDEGPLASRR